MLSETSERGQVSLGVRLPEVRREEFVLSVIEKLTRGLGLLLISLPPPHAFPNGVTI